MPIASEVHRDIVIGTEYEENDREGRLVRVFRVDGLNPGPRITTDALYAIDPFGRRIPRAGQRHESLKDLVVRAVRVVPVANSPVSCRIFVSYEKIRRRLLDVRLNSASQMTTTNIDRHGDVIWVGYKGPSTVNGSVAAGAKPPPPTDTRKKATAGSQNANSGWEYNYANVPFFQPDDVLEITYLEVGSPHTKLQPYVRRLNSRPWQGGEPREWFFEGYSAQVDSPIPINLGDLPNQEVVTGNAVFFWVVTYRFRKLDKPGKSASPGWDPLVLFVDINTGRTPNGVDPKKGNWPREKLGNGWRKVELYDEADFNALNLVSAVTQAY